MAIIQALLALVSRSLGRVLSAVFGWAVVALFGETSGAKKMWLSALVAAAAAWPILLIGVAAPPIAVVVVAVVPLPRWVPEWALRTAWIVLAAAVPLAVGVAMAARRPTITTLSRTPAPAAHESRWLRMARGFPITIGVAGAFLIVFVT